MRITKQKLKQIVKEEIQKALEGKKLDGYSNLPADAKVELIDFINNNLSHEQGPDEWLAAIQRAIQIEPRGVGYKPADATLTSTFLRRWSASSVPTHMGEREREKILLILGTVFRPAGVDGESLFSSAVGQVGG